MQKEEGYGGGCLFPSSHFFLSLSRLIHRARGRRVVWGGGGRVRLGNGLACIAMRLPVRLLAVPVAVVGRLAAGAAASSGLARAGGAGFGGKGDV